MRASVIRASSRLLVRQHVVPCTLTHIRLPSRSISSRISIKSGAFCVKCSVRVGERFFFTACKSFCPSSDCCTKEALFNFVFLNTNTPLSFLLTVGATRCWSSSSSSITTSTISPQEEQKQKSQPNSPPVQVEKIKVAACGDVDSDNDSDDEMEMEDMFVDADQTFDHGMAEWGGPRRGGRLPEPTRYGDWERKGRCSDF